MASNGPLCEGPLRRSLRARSKPRRPGEEDSPPKLTRQKHKKVTTVETQEVVVAPKKTKGRGKIKSVRAAAETHSRLTQERLARLRQNEKDRLLTKIEQLSEEEAKSLLLQYAERNPSSVLDILEKNTRKAQEEGGGGGSPNPGNNSPGWCVCGNCREMPTDSEKLCCEQTPNNCHSCSPFMEHWILNPGVLRLQFLLRNEVFGLHDQAEADNNRSYRHCAYRQWVLQMFGTLGEGNRLVIPSCVVWAIRDRYPSVNNIYTGFIPGRLN